MVSVVKSQREEHDAGGTWDLGATDLRQEPSEMGS